MKIVLGKKEFLDLALKALKNKYDKVLPEDEEAIIDMKYDGTVEIEFIKIQEVA